MAARTPPPLTLPGGRPLHDAYDAAEGTDHLAIPHVFSFASLIGGANKTYWHERFDEAMRHSRENALAMRRDAFPMSLLRERKLAVMSLPWYLEVPDPKNKVQAETRALLTQNLRATRGFSRMLWSWLEAIWYGRYGNQFSWKWRQIEGKRCLAVRKWKPVNGDKIGYTWDDTPYVLVGARGSTLPGAEIINTTRARAVKLAGPWRERFVIHQHEIDDGDYFEAEGADGIHGVGVRSRIYWLDFLKRDYLEWCVTYLERVGLGITLWKYDASSKDAKEKAEEAARENSRRTNITVPVWPNTQGGMTGGVERIEVPTGGIEVLRSMMDGIDGYIERYMVGQAGSARSSASGIGNEAASEFMSSTKDQIRDSDANLLAETITGDEEEPGLIWLMQKYSCPETLDGKPGGFPVSLKFGLERTLNSQRVSTIKDVNQLGLDIRKDDIYNAAGLSRPEPHDDVLRGQQPQQQPGMGGLLGDQAGQQQPGNPALPGAGDQPASPDDVEGLLGDLGLGGGGGQEQASPDDVDSFLADLFGDGDQDEGGDSDEGPTFLPPASMMPAMRAGYEPQMDPETGAWQVGDESIDPRDLEPEPEPARYDRGDRARHYGDGDEGDDSAPAWVEYTGPKGGRGWRNTVTGDIVYGPNRPGGTRGHHKQQQEKHKQKAKETLTQPVRGAMPVHDPVAMAHLEAVLPGLDAQQLVGLVGAQGGATVQFSKGYGWPPGSDSVNVTVQHPFITNCTRTILVSPSGETICRNNLFFVKKKHRRGGFGMAQFSAQVKACAAAGIDAIETCAGRGGGMNGYYTWARLGYDCELTEGFRNRIHDRAKRMLERQGVPSDEAGIRAAQLAFGVHRNEQGQVIEKPPMTVQDLMATPDGRALWKERGYQTAMRFDLHPGSKSMQVLNAYLAEKGKPPLEIDAGQVEQARAKLRTGRAQVKEKQARQERESREQAAQKQAEQRAQMRTRMLGEAQKWGLDPDEVVDEAKATIERLMAAGNTYEDAADNAYRFAAHSIAQRRHFANAQSPAMDPVHAHYEQLAREAGLNPKRVRGVAAGTPVVGTDLSPEEALRHAYEHVITHATRTQSDYFRATPATD